LTIEGGLVPNEICANAKSLVVVPELLADVPLASAKADPEVTSLFSCSSQIIYPLLGHPNRAVWYFINSTSATCTASIQDNAAAVSVFSGSCEDLEYRPPSGESASNPLGAPYSWESALGQVYVIYIHYSRNEQSGNVQMTLYATNDTMRN
jgi:hypothetical protein